MHIHRLSSILHISFAIWVLAASEIELLLTGWHIWNGHLNVELIANYIKSFYSSPIYKEHYEGNFSQINQNYSLELALRSDWSLTNCYKYYPTLLLWFMSLFILQYRSFPSNLFCTDGDTKTTGVSHHKIHL